MKKKTTKESNSYDKNQLCWYCILLCPLILFIFLDIILITIINKEYNEQKQLENKINIISKPLLAYNEQTIINCTTINPCNIYCAEYLDITENELDDCKFNYLLIGILTIIFILCNCPMIFKLLELCIGYIVYNYCNKDTKHHQIEQAEV